MDGIYLIHPCSLTACWAPLCTTETGQTLQTAPLPLYSWGLPQAPHSLLRLGLLASAQRMSSIIIQDG